MWVLLAKQDSNGWFSRMKGRLTVLGNQERDVVSKALAYAPVAAAICIRLVLAMHIHELDQIKLYHCDIQQAYLEAKHRRKIYVRHPPGFVIFVNKSCDLDFRRKAPGEKVNTVLPLILALYGGMECGRLFWEVYTEFHFAIGFVKIPQEPCFLVKH